jgi:serine/threonine protein kinase
MKNHSDMQATNRELRRTEIEENTVDYYRTAGGTRPDLRVVEIDGKKLIAKDFKRSDFLFRAIVGPILIRREFGAMRNLIGVNGVPQIAGRIDKYALAMEHVSGTSLEHVSQGVLTNEFYTKLRSVIDEMHSRGIAHCDLRSRGNVMLGDDGNPYVVDFAACVFRGRGINPFTRWLFKQFVLADNNAVLRIKDRLSPELLTDEEKAELETPLPLEIPARFVGSSIRKITRKLLTKHS